MTILTRSWVVLGALIAGHGVAHADADGEARGVGEAGPQVAAAEPVADGAGDTPVAGPTINPFRCRGEAEALARDLSGDELDTEISRRVGKRAATGAADEPATVLAHEACVVAELKRRVGAGDTDEWYERAIAINPDEPGYELWYGSYLGGVRGAGGPLIEAAERHYYRGIEKLDRKRQRGPLAEHDAITAEWLQRRLLDLYQRDGAPVLGLKSFRYGANDLDMPGVTLSAIAQVSADTRDFYYSNEMRSLTGEAAFAESALRLGRPLTNTEKFDLIRAPLRAGVDARLRLRHNWVGALDLQYKKFTATDAQIGVFTSPNEYVDIGVTEIGGAYSRVFDLYPLFDLDVRGGVRYVDRTGTVEYLPDESQQFLTYEVTPTISRFIGPDKLSLRGAYVLMDIAPLDGGMPYERDRGQTIRALHLEYAMYRKAPLPSFSGGRPHFESKYTRGWHFFAGAAEDSSIYGLRQVLARDLYAGSTLKGLGEKYDVTLQGTIYQGSTKFVDPADPGAGLQSDPSQGHTQYRTTFALARRLIDEDITPGLPKSSLGFAPASLVLVVPISHDLAVKGSNAFEDVRIGAELWLKLIGTGLGGTTFLITAGYDYEYFYRQTKAMHMGHLAIRMGW